MNEALLAKFLTLTDKSLTLKVEALALALRVESLLTSLATGTKMWLLASCLYLASLLEAALSAAAPAVVAVLPQADVT